MAADRMRYTIQSLYNTTIHETCTTVCPLRGFLIRLCQFPVCCPVGCKCKPIYPTFSAVIDGSSLGLRDAMTQTLCSCRDCGTVAGWAFAQYTHPSPCRRHGSSLKHTKTLAAGIHLFVVRIALLPEEAASVQRRQCTTATPSVNVSTVRPGPLCGAHGA